MTAEDRRGCTRGPASRVSRVGGARVLAATKSGACGSAVEYRRRRSRGLAVALLTTGGGAVKAQGDFAFVARAREEASGNVKRYGRGSRGGNCRG